MLPLPSSSGVRGTGERQRLRKFLSSLQNQLGIGVLEEIISECSEDLNIARTRLHVALGFPASKRINESECSSL